MYTHDILRVWCFYTHNIIQVTYVLCTIEDTFEKHIKNSAITKKNKYTFYTFIYFINVFVFFEKQKYKFNLK